MSNQDAFATGASGSRQKIKCRGEGDRNVEKDASNGPSGDHWHHAEKYKRTALTPKGRLRYEEAITRNAATIEEANECPREKDHRRKCVPGGEGAMENKRGKNRSSAK